MQTLDSTTPAIDDLLDEAPVPAESDLMTVLHGIGTEVAAPVADDVDRHGRFPRETIDALRAAKLLGVAVTPSLGGAGLGLPALTRMCMSLGQHCASSAMILAMHHIQVLCLVRHGQEEPRLCEYLRSLTQEQRLIASVTSEVGPSGELRRSVAAVTGGPDRFELLKQATTISYGQQADDLLITARRHPEAPPSDQVLVLAPRDTFKLANIGEWNTLGMRGTCSPGATVRAQGDAWHILHQPFGDIATYTMVPVSHVLWAGCWLGIASDAVARARRMLRRKARSEPGKVPRGTTRLSALVAKLQLFRDQVFATAEEYQRLADGNDRDALASFSFAIRINNLKLSASRLVVEIVGESLEVCGIAAYKNDSPFSLGRHLRDAYSSVLMISNDRIHETNAALLMVHKGD